MEIRKLWDMLLCATKCYILKSVILDAYQNKKLKSLKLRLICSYFRTKQWSKNFRAPRGVENTERLFCYPYILYQKQ